MLTPTAECVKRLAAFSWVLSEQLDLIAARTALILPPLNKAQKLLDHRLFGLSKFAISSRAVLPLMSYPAHRDTVDDFIANSGSIPMVKLAAINPGSISLHD
jgi:hypothetical protein